jgi:hypothetical protein
MSWRLPLYLLIGLHLILLFATKFTLWPEMVVYPYLLNHGFLLYSDLINPYPPLVTVFLSSYTGFFGYTPIALRLLTYAVVISIDILIFNFSTLLFKSRKAAIVNTLFFVLLSIPFGVNGLWFDLFQTPFILASIYYLVSEKKPGNFPIAIGLLTVAFFIKQQAIWILPVYILYAFRYYKLFKKDFGRIALESIGAAVVLTLANLGLVFLFGTLPEYISWAVIFPFATRVLPGYIDLPGLPQVLLVAALFISFVSSILKDKKNTGVYGAAALLLLFGFPRFDYFHLVPSIAVLSLLAFDNFRGLTLPSLNRLSQRGETSTRKVLTAAFYLFFIPVLIFSAKQYKKDFGFQTRFFEPEIYQSAQRISASTKPKDLLYMQNSSDQLLVLSSRLPVKPWADEFPWYLEYGNTQKNVLSAVQNNKPAFVVSYPYVQGSKFQLGAYHPVLIASYLEKNYKVISNLGGNLVLKQKVAK